MNPGGPRAGRHRPAGLVPIAYLAAIVAVDGALSPCTASRA
jgi:hypothetical protein